MPKWSPPNMGAVSRGVNLLAKTLQRFLVRVPYLHKDPVGTLTSTFIPGSYQLAFQMGWTGAVTTSATGRVVITFPEAFPNGLAIALATRTSGAGNAREISVDTAVGATNKSQVTFILADSAGALQNSTSVQFTWLAIGF